MKTLYELEMASIKSQLKNVYRPPLCTKKQRVEMKPERNGKPYVYSEEEKMLYLMKNFRFTLLTT